MASVAAGYLPILLFLGVAIVLSTAFVVLPIVAAKFTGAAKFSTPWSFPWQASLPVTFRFCCFWLWRWPCPAHSWCCR